MTQYVDVIVSSHAHITTKHLFYRDKLKTGQLGNLLFPMSHAPDRDSKLSFLKYISSMFFLILKLKESRYHDSNYLNFVNFSVEKDGKGNDELERIENLWYKLTKYRKDESTKGKIVKLIFNK